MGGGAAVPPSPSPHRTLNPVIIITFSGSPIHVAILMRGQSFNSLMRPRFQRTNCKIAFYISLRRDHPSVSLIRTDVPFPKGGLLRGSSSNDIVRGKRLRVHVYKLRFFVSHLILNIFRLSFLYFGHVLL